jgi:protein SCO1
MSKRGLVVLLGFLMTVIAMVLAYIAFLVLDSPGTELDNRTLSPVSLIEPPLPIPDFILTNQLGEAISLSDLRGKPVLLTFGFTHCPDVCPITLGEMREIYNSLDNQSDNLHFVFISVDGQRDTPEILADYLTTLRVDNFIIGMTGTEEEIREMGIPFGLDFSYSEADALGNYSVEHTAGMFLLNTEGQWIRRYAYGTLNEEIVTDLRGVLQ